MTKSASFRKLLFGLLVLVMVLVSPIVSFATLRVEVGSGQTLSSFREAELLPMVGAEAVVIRNEAELNDVHFAIEPRGFLSSGNVFRSSIKVVTFKRERKNVAWAEVCNPLKVLRASYIFSLDAVESCGQRCWQELETRSDVEIASRSLAIVHDCDGSSERTPDFKWQHLYTRRVSGKPRFFRGGRGLSFQAELQAKERSNANQQHYAETCIVDALLHPPHFTPHQNRIPRKMLIRFNVSVPSCPLGPSDVRVTSNGAGTRVNLIDIQTVEGDLYYWSDRTLANVPAVITADGNPALVTYQPWLLVSPSFKRSRSMQTDTGTFTVQNVFGDILARAFERIVRRSAMEGALFVYRFWNAAAEQADLEFHDKLTWETSASAPSRLTAHSSSTARPTPPRCSTPRPVSLFGPSSAAVPNVAITPTNRRRKI